MVKSLPASAEDTDSILGSERCPGEESGNPIQDSCLGNPTGQRSLVGYSAVHEVAKELDMT